MMMRYFSMFSGIGGFELGINKAYKKYNLKEPKCIGFSEINKYAIKIYKKQFPKHKEYGDATKIIWGKIPRFELFVAGFPCQSFSTAGKRGGFKDTRGTLFFEIARCIKAKKPKLLLLENVEGLCSHNTGETFGTILSTLSGLGYILEWQILNSKDFRTPHNRKRVFIAGHLGKISRQTIFPIQKRNKKIRGNNKCNKIPAIYFDDSFQKAKTRRGRVMTLCGALMNTPRGGVALKINKTLNKILFRRFTPIEYERLQSFPDDWTKGISDNQRYKCLGNAVTVNVIEVIIQKLLKINGGKYEGQKGKSY